MLVVLIAGCGHCGSQTVTRRWFDCNHYGTPAYVKDRIDVRPPRASRVAMYRWAHVSGPALPLGACRSMMVESVGYEATPPIEGPAPSDGPSTTNLPVPAPQLLLEEDSVEFPTDTLRRDAAIEEFDETPRPPDASARRSRVRTSWLFRDLD